MINVVKLSILFCIQFVLVQCIIPSLNVRRVDKTAVAKKRQDTLDMCRIFNEETVKVNNIFAPVDIIKSYSHPRLGRNRFKRSAPKYAVNPALNKQDEQRVEAIVDKLYDDIDDYQKTNYSKGNLKEKPKQPSRRFDFAPQMMQGPDDTANNRKEKEVPPAYESKGRWKHGVIPYFIDPKSYDAQLAEQIMKAFDYVEKATCIRLQKLREKPVDEESMTKVNWVYITNPTGIRQCVHSNEHRPLDGVQMTVLGYDCMTQGDIVHEVMHILGYTHEHLRSDRDQYISVLWDNIKPGYRKYFDINGFLGNLYDLESLPYDYASIMHYPARAFSKNGQPTIIAEEGVKIGQREGLSEIDIEKVGLIYTGECVERNREYLLKTCPSVVKANIKPANVTQDAITEYFRDRLWPFGVIPYKFRDHMEFSAEERENIRAVFNHIEKETCILFRDMGADDESKQVDSENHWKHMINEADDIEPDTNSDKNLNEIKLDAEVSGEQTNGTELKDKNVVTDTEVSGEQTNGTELYDKNVITDTEVSGDQTNGTELKDKNVITDTEVSGEQINVTGLNDNNNDKVDTEVSGGQTNGTELNDSKNVTLDNEISGESTTEKQIKIAKRIRTIIRPRTNRKGKIIKKPTKSSKKLLKKWNKKKKLLSKLALMRRHAGASLTLARSTKPGCQCPNPGKPNGDVVLEVNADCFNSANDLLHYFVHILGLDHQHNMHDRDSYLQIAWNNLNDDLRQDMTNKLPPAASLGFTYDYQSVMHYPWLEIKNGKTNIMYPIWNDGWSMGHWQGLSSTDVQKLNLLYFQQCSQRAKEESM